MGFRLNKTYVLEFADGFMAGAEVRMRGCSFGKLMEIHNATDEEAADLMAPFLVSWNMDDADGAPLPTTGDGIRGLEYAVFIQLGKAWAKALTGIPDDLGKGSTSGASYPEESIPTVS